MATRKICIVTGTRAEWGLLSPIARELQLLPEVELQIVVTNMHLDPRYGYTVEEITTQGFTVNAKVEIHDSSADDSDASKVKAMARCCEGMVDALSALSPDIIVILGDRYEMLAVASTAMMLGIPIAHLHGGEITLGAVDNSIRHAITKMSSLHLASTEAYRQRIIQMGELPERVINTGAIGVHNALKTPVMPLEQLAESIGFTPDRRTILLTYHPATLDNESPTKRFKAITDAIERLPNDIKVLITYPNNDARGLEIIRCIEGYKAANPYRVFVIPSLGMRRYISALHYVGAVVGNSSSGIIEVPSTGIPTVDIGIRQQGRDASKSVIHCGDTADEIFSALQLAFSSEFQDFSKTVHNPYFKPDTLQIIVDALTKTDITANEIKQFYDLKL